MCGSLVVSPFLFTTPRADAHLAAQQAAGSVVEPACKPKARDDPQQAAEEQKKDQKEPGARVWYMFAQGFVMCLRARAHGH